MDSNGLVVVLDCDGVILDANEMKTEAFAAVLSAYPQPVVADFLSYQRGAFGRSRFKLLGDFFDRFLRQPVTEATMTNLLDDFGRICVREYLRVPMTESAEEFLRQASPLHRLYVASGSKQEELRLVFEQRRLRAYFKDVLGSPTPKTELLADIVAREAGRRAVFVGDAHADWDAAQANGVEFVFMGKYSNERAELSARARAAHVPVIECLSELLPLLGALHSSR